MSRHRTGLRILVVILLVTPILQAAQEFTEVMPPDAKGAGWEIRASDPWHKGSTCGGAGFVVAVGQWPQITQQGYLDRVGTRELQFIMQWHDVGQIRAGTAAQMRRLVNSTWCAREYAFGVENDGLHLCISRLTPSLLAKTSANAVELFAGEKYVGERWIGDGQQRRVQAHIGSGGRQKVRTKDVPGYVAYVKAGEVVTASTDNEIDLAEMSEPWLLFWYAEKSQFLATAVPNLLWRTEPLNKAMQNGDYFVEVDIPILVVLQHKPKTLSKSEDSLKIDFAEAKVGAITVTPVMGYFHPKVEETKKWVDSLPDDVTTKCRAWAKRSIYYPVACSQSYDVADDGSEVKIRNEFTYEQITNDWNLEAEKIAPVPPVIALAAKYGFDVAISGKPASEAIMTHSGPYSGIIGADAVEFSVKGLNRYVNECVKTKQATSDDAKVLQAEVSKEIEKMVEAGHLAPAWLVGRKHTSRCETLFANPRYLLQVIADSLPYLTEDRKQAALEYAAAEMKIADPMTVSAVPVWKGTRREYYDIVSPDFYDRVTRDKIRREHLLAEDRRLDNIYALCSLAQATGDWDYLKGTWDDFKKRVYAVDNGADWAICGHFKTSDAWAGSTQSTNAHFARYLAMARAAEHFGDNDAKDRAYYMLAKAALRRFCQGKIIEYVYDEKFQQLEMGPDWMLKLSTDNGETGTQQLWFDKWTGAKEDVRVPVFWDEYGPVLDYMDDDWTPQLVWFLNITPELGRFLKDELKPECDRHIAAVERNAPAWYVTDRESYLGKETSVDSPENAWSIFLAKCYVQGADGADMFRYQDVPAWKVGDLLHLSKLIANLRSFGGIEYQPAKGGAQ